MLIALLLVTVVLLLLVIESRIVKKSVTNISLRIHINGTRGKTTVTKYISAILRDTERRTFGKVTGDAPILLMPDGKEKRINRKGSARVQEQFNIIKLANKNKANALVMECMSIDPTLQQLESTFFKPNIYIITNIRDDHREIMGNTLDKQILSICNAIPVKSKIISIDSPYKKIIEEQAKARESVFIECTKLTESELFQVPRNIHYSNIELALTAAIESGISREKAFQSILNYISISQSPLHSIPGETKKYFLNAFSVNDPQSATDFLHFWKKELAIQDKIAVVFNTRADRPLRTLLFAEWMQTNKAHISDVVLTGDHRFKAKRTLSSMNLIDIKVNCISLSRKKEIRAEILKAAGTSPLILGIGNIKGVANQIINEFSEAS